MKSGVQLTESSIDIVVTPESDAERLLLRIAKGRVFVHRQITESMVISVDLKSDSDSGGWNGR